MSGTAPAGGGSAAAGAAPKTHRVVKGDTLWAISRKYGVALNALIALNPQIKDPDLDPGGRRGEGAVTAYVLTAAGERWQLPPAVEWELEYTAGVPCDSFFYRCPSRGCGGADPALWHRFEGYEGEQLVFRGVVDECVRTISAAGEQLELSGRGLAALLLDNEALPRDYGTATAEDILDGHVRPYADLRGAGLCSARGEPLLRGGRQQRVVGGVRLCPVSRRCAPPVRPGGAAGAVPVERRRAPRSGGQYPGDRADGDGQALWGAVRRVGAGPLPGPCGKGHRSGLRGPGGQCPAGRSTVPGRGDWQAMRYTGKYQLERAGRERLRIRAEIPELFWAQPGELVQVARTGFDRSGLYRAAKVTVGADKNGGHSRVELALPDMV